MMILDAGRTRIDHVAFSPDGRLLASSAKDGSIRVAKLTDGSVTVCNWESHSDWRRRRLRHRADAIAFSPADSSLVSRNCVDGLRVWSPLPATCRKTIRLGGASSQPNWIVFSPAGDTLLLPEHSGNVRYPLHYRDALTLEPRSVLQECISWWPGMCAVFEPSGKRVAIGNDSILNASTGERKRLASLLCLDVRFMAWHPTRPILACGGAFNTIRLVDVDSGEEAARISQESKAFLGMAFTPDGKWLITVSNEATAKFWDTASWTLEQSFQWGIGPLKCVAVSPDGMCAAAGSATGKIVVWDLD